MLCTYQVSGNVSIGIQDIREYELDYEAAKKTAAAAAIEAEKEEERRIKQLEKNPLMAVEDEEDYNFGELGQHCSGLHHCNHSSLASAWHAMLCASIVLAAKVKAQRKQPLSVAYKQNYAGHQAACHAVHPVLQSTSFKEV